MTGFRKSVLLLLGTIEQSYRQITVVYNRGLTKRTQT